MTRKQRKKMGSHGSLGAHVPSDLRTCYTGPLPKGSSAPASRPLWGCTWDAWLWGEIQQLPTEWWAECQSRNKTEDRDLQLVSSSTCRKPVPWTVSSGHQHPCLALPGSHAPSGNASHISAGEAHPPSPSVLQLGAPVLTPSPQAGPEKKVQPIRRFLPTSHGHCPQSSRAWCWFCGGPSPKGPSRPWLRLMDTPRLPAWECADPVLLPPRSLDVKSHRGSQS